MMLRYLKNVATLTVEKEKCIGCGMCMEVCPHAVLAMNGHKQVQILDRDACMECGACALNCPTEALRVNSGVGCATAVINSMLGRSSAACCCTLDPVDKSPDRLNSGCC